MPTGRKPTPTRIKVLNGNPGNRKLNDREPEIRAKLQHAPDWMPEGMLELWRYAINHAPDGVLGTIDRDVLATWVSACYYRNRAIEMQATLDEKTSLELLVKTKGGDMRVSPYLVAFRQNAEVMHKAAAELGFTPSSRVRLTAAKTEDPDNPFLNL